MLMFGLGNSSCILSHLSQDPVDKGSAPTSPSCHRTQYELLLVQLVKVRSGSGLCRGISHKTKN